MSSNSIEDEEVFIELLPDEILRHIFSFLTLPQIKNRVALVSKRWYAISTNPGLIQVLKFGPSLQIETIVHVLRESPLVRSVTISSRRDTNEILTEMAASNRKLKRLKITSTSCSRYNLNTLKEPELKGEITVEIARVTDLSTADVLATLRACPGIDDLTIKRANFDVPDVFFRDVGQIRPNLKKINMNHSLQFGTRQFRDLVSEIENVEDIRLYCLSFDGAGSLTPYSEEPVIKMASKMQGTLQVLKLNMLGLQDNSVRHIVNCSFLKVLHMYRLINVQDEGLLHITRLPHLEKLLVTVPRAITTQCWNTLLSHENMSNLKMLTISNSYAIDDSVALTISVNCKSLDTLVLPGCRRMTHVGLGAVIKSCSYLTSLNLFSTKSSLVEAFHLIPEYLPNLQRLIFRCADKTIPDLAVILGVMENLKIDTNYRYV